MTARIRLATPADADAVRAIYAPFAAETPVTFEETPPTDAEVADRIASTLETHPWLVCECDGAVVGYASASRLRSMDAYRWTVELSIYVAADHRRGGVGRALYTSLFALLARQGFRDAYAVTTVPNPETEAFHDRLGFEPVGTFPAVGYSNGAWRDVKWWRREIRPKSASPESPTPLASLREDHPEAVASLVRTGEPSLDS
ncbi:MAG: N-acetyltransferase family protein [Haloferacaceae archaeon]